MARGCVPDPRGRRRPARRLPSGELRDFGSFVASADAAARGANPYGTHALTFHVVLPGFDAWNPNLNPPVSVLLFRPLLAGPPQQAFRWWCDRVVPLLSRHHRPARASLSLVAHRASESVGARAGGLLGHSGARTDLHSARADGNRRLAAARARPPVRRWRSHRDRRWREAELRGLAAGAVGRRSCSRAADCARHRRCDERPADPDEWAGDLHAVAERYSGRREPSRIPHQRLDPGPGPPRRISRSGHIARRRDALRTMVWAWREKPSVYGASAMGLLAGIIASPIAWIHYTLFLLPVFLRRDSHRCSP